MKKRKIKNHKYFFSLLELCICLVIIALASTLLGLKGYALVKKARFDMASGKLLRRMKECRSLAISHGEDLVYSLRNEEKGLLSCSGFEGGFLLEERAPHLFFSFGDGKGDVLLLRFFSTGTVKPLGTLHFYSELNKDENLMMDVDLSALFEWEEGSDKAS